MNAVVITIVHALPGRVRVNFNEPPERDGEMLSMISSIDGVMECDYSHYTSNLLIVFEDSHIELLFILKKIVLFLSGQYCKRPIHIRVNDTFSFTTFTLGSIFFILLTSALNGQRYFMVPFAKALEYTTAFVTTFSVFEHAAIEVNRTGVFDPEAFSVLYLLNSVKKGHPLKGAIWTWIAVFGRHLFPIMHNNSLRMTVIEGVNPITREKYDDVITTGSLAYLETKNTNDISRVDLIKGVAKRLTRSRLHTRKRIVNH